MKLAQLFGRSGSVDAVTQGSHRQMTRCPSRLLLAIPLLAAMASANAIPITETFTYIDVYDPPGAGDLWFASTGPNRVTTHAYSHSINSLGYDAATDAITSLSIEFSFRDDNDTVAESVTFTFDDLFFSTEVFMLPSGNAIGITTFSDTTTPALAASYLLDGVLKIKLDLAGDITGQNSSGRSDFYFVGSTLTVNAERTLTTAVPEPATVLLFGLGLLGLGWSLRRKS